MRRLLRDRVSSPAALAKALGEPLGTVSYHVRALEGAGIVELIESTPRGATIVHKYMLRDASRARTLLWRRDVTLAGTSRPQANDHHFGVVLDSDAMVQARAAVESLLGQLARLGDATEARALGLGHAEDPKVFFVAMGARDPSGANTL